ncbi:MAG: zinc-dependent metalloprotease [Acidimicrobiales bacterium]
MSSSNPPDGEFPFFDLNSLLGGLSGADPWKAAAEMATSIASGGGSEPNLDPVDRIKIEELGRVAELNVNQAIGVALPAGTRITPVTKSIWTRQSLDAYRPFFERFGEALSAGMQAETDAITPSDEDLAGADPSEADLSNLTAQMMGQIFTSLGPMLVSTSAGSMLGHLGQRALGQYDLPIPRASDEVLVVPSTIDVAAEEWDIPNDDLRLWVLIHELTTHAVLSVPHVKSRLESLLLDFASAFRPNTELINERFGSITDLGQIQELSETLSDPDVIFSLLRSPAHDLIVPQLDALVAAVLGFVDHSVTEISRGLIVTQDIIRERFRQRWIDVAPADRFMERLLGLEIDDQTLSRGDDFVAGIHQRAGAAGLERLWADELDMPTAAEVDAPGLWLARIGLDGEADSGAGLEVPDDLSGLDEL